MIKTAVSGSLVIFMISANSESNINSSWLYSGASPCSINDGDSGVRFVRSCDHDVSKSRVGFEDLLESWLIVAIYNVMLKFLNVR